MINNPVSPSFYAIAGQMFRKNSVFRRFFRSFICSILMIGVLTPCIAPAKSDGIALFEQKKYEQTIRFFSGELKTQPDNPVANFYLGRSFLALNRAGEAVDYLKNAAKLSPTNPDYQFWLGVGYWANMEFEKERQSYLEALKLSPNHLQAGLYLGHSYMDRNQWTAALNQYDRVLGINPAIPDALYNRALVFRQLGKSVDEINAWKSYLDRYRSGKRALQVAEYLNRNGDFSYRIFLLGSRKIVTPAINFEPVGNALKPEGGMALARIGEILTKKRALLLHVIVYVKGDPKLARSRAKAIRKTILKLFPMLEPSRLTVSWFDIPEKIDLGNSGYVLDESVNIITGYK